MGMAEEAMASGASAKDVVVARQRTNGGDAGFPGSEHGRTGVRLVGLEGLKRRNAEDADGAYRVQQGHNAAMMLSRMGEFRFGSTFSSAPQDSLADDQQS